MIACEVHCWPLGRVQKMIGVVFLAGWEEMVPSFKRQHPNLLDFDGLLPNVESAR